MKLSGIKVEAKYIKEITFYREETEFVFKLEAVGDYRDFETNHPPPEPPVKITSGDITYKDEKDPDYLELLEEWEGWRVHWLFIHTIKDIEWDTVTSDPSTFENWINDLEKAGFSVFEVQKLQTEISIVNGLMEPKRIEEAVKNSLAGTEVESETP